MTPEEGYLILSVLAAWVLSISAVAGIVLERRDRKSQFDQMDKTVRAFTAAVKSYEKLVQNAPNDQSNQSIKTEVERQKTLREKARLEKKRVEQQTELIKAGSKFLNRR